MWWLWAIALFAAGALSFAVEPLAGRMLLPRLGGAPAVWIVALLFFQAALLAGYLYAHALSRLAGLRTQAVAHVAVIAVACLRLPPELPIPSESGDPAMSTVLALLASVGLPYAALVATSPLLQQWLARTGATADPYALYAASNAGSLIGLLAYPFLLEPLLGLGAQASLWASAYAATVLLVALCAALAVRRSRGERGSVPHAEARSGPPISPARIARWIGLAALPTAWLGAVTADLTTAVAPLPLLWVLPLAVYLLTLVAAFAPSARVPRTGDLARWTDPAYLGAAARPGARTAVAVAALLAATRATDPAPLVIAGHLAAFAFAAVICHAALAADRPDPSSATVFYLALAAGGAAGGAFAAVLAPALFPTLFEYPLVLAAFLWSGLLHAGRAAAVPRALVFAAASVAIAALVVAGAVHWAFVGPLLAVAVLAAMGAAGRPRAGAVALLAVLLAGEVWPIPGGYRQEHVARSFFGVSRVVTSPDGGQRVLLNGLIAHGAQSLDAASAREPQSYYTREGPLGDLLRSREARGGRDEEVGVVGLGAGAIACYADGARRVTFYEIDPTVVALARDRTLFTYLALCPPEAVVLGDGRVSLQRLPDGVVDVLVVDAYSGDTVPLHLLTREALALYRRILAPEGVVALHISNRYFDLEPLVAALAADAGLTARVRSNLPLDAEPAAAAVPASGWAPSVWAVIGAEAAVRDRVGAAPGWLPLRSRPDLAPWTDDRASALAVRR